MPTVETDPQRLLTVAEVALRLRQSPWTVYRRVAAGELEVLRIGIGSRRLLRFQPEAVEKLLRPVGPDEELAE